MTVVYPDPAYIRAGYELQLYASWSLCDVCFHALMSVIQTEISNGTHGKNRSARPELQNPTPPRRRRHKSDP